MPDLKISALSAATALVGDEQIPFSKAGANGRATPRQIAAPVLRELSALLGRPLAIGFAGDSISDFAGGSKSSNSAAGASLTGTPLMLALYRDAKIEFTLDGQAAAPDGSGGNNFAMGGSPVSNLVTASFSGWGPQINLIEAKATPPDLIYLQTIQNNSMTSNFATMDGYLAEVAAFVTRCFAKGVKLIILNPRPPYTGDAAAVVPANHEYMNRLLEQYAAITPGVVFNNYLPAVKDPSASLEINGASSKVAWRTGHSGDGVHPTELGNRAIAPGLGAILAKLGRPRLPRAAYNSAYDNSTNKFGNIIGSKGLMGGTTGTLNGSADTGVATGWAVASNNGIAATPSKTTGSDGFARQRIALSGTATSAATVTLTTTYVPGAGGFEGASFIFEGLLDLVGVTGLASWAMGFHNGSFNTGDASLAGLTLSESLQLTSPRAVAVAAIAAGGYPTKFWTLTLNFASGASPGGYVEFGRVGGWRVP